MTGTVEERAAHHGLAETLRPHPAVAAVDVLATAGSCETEIVVRGRTVPPVVLRGIADARLAITHVGRQGDDVTVVMVA